MGYSSRSSRRVPLNNGANIQRFPLRKNPLGNESTGSRKCPFLATWMINFSKPRNTLGPSLHLTKLQDRSCQTPATDRAVAEDMHLGGAHHKEARSCSGTRPTAPSSHVPSHSFTDDAVLFPDFRCFVDPIRLLVHALYPAVVRFHSLLR